MGWYPRALLASLPLAVPAPGLAAQQARDAGTFVVTVNGAVIAREEFTVRDGRGDARDGFTVTARRFGPEGGDPVLVLTVELGPDSQLTTAQLAEPARQRRTYIQASPRRVTVRAVTPSGESVREYPGANALWLADDSGVAGFVLPPRPDAHTMTLLWPRDDRRETLELTDRGVESIPTGAGTLRARHVVLGSATDERHFWYDEQGRLRKVEIPGRGFIAARAGMP